jgi:hypothetical protein
MLIAADINHPARTLGEARDRARHVLGVYESALERYPQSAVFNTTDVRVLVRTIEDLVAQSEVSKRR